MNIVRMVKDHIKIHGWPSEPTRVGPGTCGQAPASRKSDCRTAHAYAEAVSQKDMFEDTPYVFIYDRPCNLHDKSTRVGGRPEYGE